MNYIHHYCSPLGNITVASDGCYIIGLWFEGQKYFADTLSDSFQETILPIFEQTDKWLDIFFSGKNPDFVPPFKIITTPFRREVWEIMLTIPFGKTMTYGEIAKKIADKRGITCMSAQAVGGAVGHNSISLVIPCHRVIGAKNNLVGYAGGIERKKKLLELEQNSTIYTAL